MKSSLINSFLFATYVWLIYFQSLVVVPTRARYTTSLETTSEPIAPGEQTTEEDPECDEGSDITSEEATVPNLTENNDQLAVVSLGQPIFPSFVSLCVVACFGIVLVV